MWQQRKKRTKPFLWVHKPFQKYRWSTTNVYWGSCDLHL
jgi:hypothetical protein